MGSVARDIFKAIHEQKWLDVEYRNVSGNTTHYWLGINALNPSTRKLEVDGLHLRTKKLKTLTIKLDSILSSAVVEGTFHHTPNGLLRAVEEDERFEALFGTVPNLKILDYLYDCAKLNSTPYAKEFTLVSRIDEDSFAYGAVQLDDNQFKQVVNMLQRGVSSSKKRRSVSVSKQIGVNLLSLHTQKGLYVLAYRELRLDARRKALAIGNNVLLCKEFSVSNEGVRESQSIRAFLDESDMPLLDDFRRNAETIKNCVTEHCQGSVLVDDMPHVFEINRHTPSYLQDEYDSIARMCNEGEMSYPIRAFFGNLVRRPIRRKELSPIVSKPPSQSGPAVGNQSGDEVSPHLRSGTTRHRQNEHY